MCTRTIRLQHSRAGPRYGSDLTELSGAPGTGSAAASRSVAPPAGFERWVLIRRNLYDAQDLAYYLVFAQVGTSLAELAGAAGLRWNIGECFRRAKEELELDHRGQGRGAD